MPRKKSRHKKPSVEHTHLTVKIESYEANIGAGVNHDAYEPRYAWQLDDRDPVYQFSSHLRIKGIVTAPEPREGNAFELQIHGEERTSSNLDLTLKEIQKRNEYDAPEYRTYRGKEIPIYNPPNGLGLTEKVRGEPAWTSWIFVKPSFVSDAFKLLALDKQLYLTIHERKEGRSRWVQNASIQSEDPEAEED